jgi:hypothetical protein
MATETKKPEAAASVATAAEAASPTSAGASTLGDMGPVVVEKKKRKRKYSRGLKEIQQASRGLSKAGRTIARAVEAGVSRYVREENKSSRKRRDGALLDVLENAGDGLSKAVREASPISKQVFRALNRKSVRKQVRAVVRTFASPFLR